MNQNAKPGFVLNTTLLGLGLALGAPAFADNALGLLLSETLTYDTNILKDDRQKRSDTVSSTGVKVFLDKSYGRQQYTASVLGVFQRYKNQKDYDNDGYQIDLGLSSEIGARGLVSLEHDAGKTLQDVSGQGLTRYRETLTTRSTRLNGRYGLYGKWGLSGALNSDEVKYSNRDFQDQTTSGARLGLRYSPSDLLYFDLGLRKSESQRDKYPFFYNDGGLSKLSIGEKVDRTDINLVTRWVVTGYSILNAEISATNENYNKDNARDFDGFTGRATWQFTPRGKVSYSFALTRDTNNAGGYTNTDPILGLLALENSQKRLTTGLQGTANWAATSKISANLGFTWRKLEEEEQDRARDRITRTAGSYRSASVGLKYVPSRWLSFNCNVSSYKRSGTVLAVGYSGETYACTAGFVLN